jgi:hypothetical protein
MFFLVDIFSRNILGANQIPCANLEIFERLQDAHPGNREEGVVLHITTHHWPLNEFFR